MGFRHVSRRTPGSRLLAVFPVALLCVVMLGSLVMLSEAVQDSARFDELYSLLLLINVLGLGTFIVLIGANVRRLVVQLRRRLPGARLSLRMLSFFTVLAVTPVVVLYGFSLHFLRQGIDSWFDVRIEAALEDALELSRASLDLRMRELLKQTQRLAEELAEGTPPVAPLNLDRLRAPGSTIVANRFDAGAVSLDTLRNRSGAHELLLLSDKGSLEASSSIDNTQIVPNLPSEAILLQIKQGRSYIGLDPIRDAGLYVRVAVNVPGNTLGRDGRVLQALYPISARMNKLAANVEAAFVQYNELAYLREQLKISFTMSLTLVLLFSVFSAVWAAFHSARRLVAPIRDLAEGTEQVARGNYETTLPVTSRDELGFLVRSFNEMTRRIAAARDEARRNRDEVDAQRAYLAAVLGRLSSGVLTIDAQGCVRTANASAAQILGIGERPLGGQPLARIAAEHRPLAPFVDAITPFLEGMDNEWQTEVILFGAGGRQVLMCRGTILPGGAADHAGHVIVFDDITALVQAQRNAAWSEAARRLAHEIKNPLTPIQLSAERLRHKYLRTMKAEDAEVLDRLTHTIVQQVETMKGMVNTFSEYARPPRIQQQPLAVNALAEEVVELFRSVKGVGTIDTRLAPDLPLVYADAGRLRQVLNNLVKNALEATPEGREPRVTISTAAGGEPAAPFVEIRVEDEGEGIAQDMLAALFDPYVTSKPRGTGLGLAIVRKIIEEHGGVVWIENRAQRGACATIRLPANSRASTPESARNLHRDAV